MANINTTFDATVMKNIKKAVGGTKEEMRKLFDSKEDALVAFKNAATIATAAGVAVNANEITEGNTPVVAVVGARERDAKGVMQSGIRAVVMFSMPTTDAIIEHEEGRKWLDKIVEKELAHVAFRRLRNAESAEELELAAKSIPDTIDAFIASYNVGEGLDTDSFDKVWLTVKKLVKEKNAALVELLPGKADVIKAMRSKAFAESQTENGVDALEKAGVFVYLLKGCIGAAKANTTEDGKPDELDTSEMEKWLAERDTFVLPSKAETVKDFSILEGLNLSF